jgi:hypothetical protein
MSSIRFNKFCWIEKFLNEPLHWTTRESTRRYVALEENSKINENAHVNLLRVSRFRGSIHRFESDFLDDELE